MNDQKGPPFSTREFPGFAWENRDARPGVKPAASPGKATSDQRSNSLECTRPLQAAPTMQTPHVLLGAQNCLTGHLEQFHLIHSRSNFGSDRAWRSPSLTGLWGSTNVSTVHPEYWCDLEICANMFSDHSPTDLPIIHPPIIHLTISLVIHPSTIDLCQVINRSPAFLSPSRHSSAHLFLHHP